MAEPTPIIDNPSILRVINPLERAYTTDLTYGGYVVDVAILQEDMNTITRPDVYTINLTPVYLSFAGFKAMFYRNGQKFQPMSGLYRFASSKEFVLNEYRTIYNYTPECGQCDLQLDGSFNLLTALLTAYQQDLGFSTECWDTCSLMEFYSIIDKIKALTDITGECGTGVKCSITLDEFFAQLEMQGLLMDPSNNLPIDPSSNNGVYPGLVTAVITANFHSTTPGVKDVVVKWPFIINFGSFNNATAIADNLGISGGTYPVYYYIDNDFITFRSPDLSFNTVDVDVVNDILVAKEASSTLKLPAYDRYHAEWYSKIFYETL